MSISINAFTKSDLKQVVIVQHKRIEELSKTVQEQQQINNCELDISVEGDNVLCDVRTPFTCNIDLNTVRRTYEEDNPTDIILNHADNYKIDILEDSASIVGYSTKEGYWYIKIKCKLKDSKQNIV